jgi:hypothetical protein
MVYNYYSLYIYQQFVPRGLIMIGMSSRGFHLAYRDFGVPICSRVAVELMALGSHL